MVAVPAVLILTIVLVMPRRADAPVEFSRATEPFGRAGYEHKKHSGGAAEEKYAVVVDAGSTGSRVHIFKFLVVDGALELQFDKFEQLKPGLSSYADNPPAAAQSLKPLLDLAMETVPKALQASTHVMVGATAGLRLLPDGKADVILGEVRKWLREGYPFQFSDVDDVKILSGVDEGAFAWLTLNYLLGNLGKAEHGTVASIDLGEHFRAWPAGRQQGRGRRACRRQSSGISAGGRLGLQGRRRRCFLGACWEGILARQG